MTTYWPLVRVSIDKETKKLIILRTFKSLLTMITLSFIHHLMVERGFMVCKQAVLPHEIEAIFQQRYDIFVEEYGFFPTREETLESDKYDEFALLFGVWDHNVLAASCRVIMPNPSLPLPTPQNLMTKPLFIATPRTAEISRITISKPYRGFKNAQDIFRLMQSEICKMTSRLIDEWVGAVNPFLLKLLNKAGLPYRPIGPNQFYIGDDRVPVVLSKNDYTKSHEC